MKFMSFNSSCAFAGIANLLEAFNIEKEDREVAIGMKLPYLFDFDESSSSYLTGASLQNGELFNLYLNTLGVNLEEKICSKQDAIETLKTTSKELMLGIRINEENKHAVIFKKKSGTSYLFLNNKHKESDEPHELLFDETELFKRLSDTVVLGWLQSCGVQKTCFRQKLDKSLSVFNSYKTDILNFCKIPHSFNELRLSMNRLFRPLLLDGLAMMELIGNAKLILPLRELQGNFLTALKKQTEIALEDELPIDTLSWVIDEYFLLIKKHCG